MLNAGVQNSQERVAFSSLLVAQVHAENTASYFDEVPVFTSNKLEVPVKGRWAPAAGPSTVLENPSKMVKTSCSKVGPC